MSLLSALSIVKETLTNSVMAERIDEVATKLREARALAVPLMEAEVFPRLGVHMVMVGEETGRCPKMLIQVADVFDREVKDRGQTHPRPARARVDPGPGALLIGAIIMSFLVAILSVNELRYDRGQVLAPKKPCRVRRAHRLMPRRDGFPLGTFNGAHGAPYELMVRTAHPTKSMGCMVFLERPNVRVGLGPT